MNANKDVSSIKRSSLSFHDSQKLLWERAGSPIKSRSPTRSKSTSPIKIIDLERNIETVKPVKHDESLTWYEKYAPKSIEEVLIHKKKLSDVEEVVRDMLSNDISSPRILLLTGPSGCSKSTVIKQLVQKWVPYYRNIKTGSLSEMFSLSEESKSTDFFVEYDNSLSLNEMGSLESFKDFLNRTKYLNNRSKLSVVFVEDLPNVFHHETRLKFQKVLEEWLFTEQVRLPPLIISITECEISDENGDKYNGNNFDINNSFTAETILSKDILDNPRLKRIKFNPINMTLMKKLLNKVANNEKLLLQSNGKWSQKNQYIAKIVENGDIRSCLSAFQFWATSIYNDERSMELYTKNNSVNYFHALGKVLFGSQEISDDNEMITKLLANSRGLIFTDNFKLGVLENYSTYRKGNVSINDAYEIVEKLSASDVFVKLPESVEYYTRSIRQILNKLQLRQYGDKLKKESQHGTSIFPREWKCKRMMNTFRIQSEDLKNVSLFKYDQPICKNDIIINLGYFSPLIRQRQNYKKRSLETYLGSIDEHERSKLQNRYHNVLQIDPDIDVLDRIGGPWSNVSVENNIKSSDDMNLEINRDIYKLEMKKRKKLKTLMEIRENLHDIVDDNGDGQLDDTDMLMLDPLVDSDDENNKNGKNDKEIEDLLDDDEDDSIFEMLSQQKSKLSNTRPDNSELLSDSDLEGL